MSTGSRIPLSSRFWALVVATLANSYAAGYVLARRHGWLEVLPQASHPSVLTLLPPRAPGESWGLLAQHVRREP